MVYHSLIPEYISDRLEAVQKQAMKIIYGFGVDYTQLLANNTVATLKKRREESVLRFALKASASERFGKAWFKETPASDREVRHRTRNKYIEKAIRTERGKNNPLQYMTRVLNEHNRN